MVLADGLACSSSPLASWLRVEVREEQVSHLGRTGGERHSRFVQGLVGPGEPAGVLAQVFAPRRVLGDLEELRWVRPVLVQLAAGRAGAQPGAANLLHD